MHARWLAALALAAGSAAPSFLAAQATHAAPPPERAIRRDIPLTGMIRRAFAAGTRDSTGRPGRNYWQLWMDYTIQARLDPATSTVTGRETAVIHNNSDSAMSSIQLRLDQNLFTANVPRDDQVPEITDGMQVTRLAVNGQPVDLHAAPRQRGQPPMPMASLAAFNLDQTTARIVLASPIPAHGTGTIDAEWSFRVPNIADGRGYRMGRWADSLYQVAQWYPRVAVFDDLRQGGWDTEPYLGSSEFYNNFGRFDVTIDVPAGWIVGASGTLQNAAEVLTSAAQERLTHVLEADTTRTIVGANERGPGQATAAGDRLRWHFVADTVGDFAWATSRQYVWEASRASLPDGRKVPIQILYLPGHAAAWTNAGPTVRHALEFYSRLWMPYAFPQLTIVDGPESGMEYPGLIMSGVGAADHETGHQWWPMMVGVNETWYGFMDEGFNQTMNILSRQDRQHQPLTLAGVGQGYGRVSGDEREGPLMWNANYGGPLYVFQAYGKAPMMLSMLGGIVGDTAVTRAMSEYANAWRFRHPSPWDYAFFMSNALHRDLGWFWYYWLFTTETVDGAIAQVTKSGSRTSVTVRQAGQMPSPVVLKVRFAPTGPAIRPMRGSVMTDSVTAIVTWPVDVWFGGSRSFEAVLDFGPRAIERITLDPECRFPDADATDNMWPRDPDWFAQQAQRSRGRFGAAACYAN